MTYGHGDVVAGYDTQWDNQMSPWHITKDGKRWYGRGTADNKGQHTINIAALKTVLETRGKLGFNVTILIEMGEERGSPGLKDFCAAHQEFIQGRCLYRIGRAANPSLTNQPFSWDHAGCLISPCGLNRMLAGIIRATGVDC